MKRQSMRGRLLASTMICGVMAFGVAGAASADDANQGQEVIVTGSRIPQPNLNSVSPVTQVSDATIKVEGVTKVEDLLNNLPMVNPDQGSAVSNGANGTAAVDLRGLGTNRTLVLVDGRRVQSGSPGSSVVDLNFIPSALVQRVEVDTSAGSSIYGSDAIAGVVNFIMKKDFEGIQMSAGASVNQHDNHDGTAAAAVAARGFAAAPSSDWDGTTHDINVIIGANTEDHKGNATLYLGYRHTDPVLQNSRDFSNCGISISHTTGHYSCGGSGTNATGQFIPYTQDSHNNVSSFADLTVNPTTGNTFRNYSSTTDAFNFNPYNYFQRSDERYTGGGFAHYEINNHADVYSQFMFMDDHTVAQIAPSGLFGQTFILQCNNPMLTAPEQASLCPVGTPSLSVANGGGGPGTVTMNILRRNVEGGGRQADLRHTDYREVFGVKGEITPAWNYDVYGSYGETVYAEEYKNDVSLANATNALNVVNVGGVLQCANSAAVAAGCVPYNIFQTGAVTAAALKYVSVPGFQSGSTTQQVVDASVNGDLGHYGVRSPWAKDGVGVAAGLEYRHEGTALNVDNEFATGDLTGQGGPTKGVSGAFDVREVFAEARLPLVQDEPFIKNLTATGSYRSSQYSLAGHTSTYSEGGQWALNDDIMFRGSMSRAERAPNIGELFAQPTLGLGGTADPCAGAIGSLTLTASQAACANTGVSAGQYGHVTANTANQYNDIEGGNQALKPETANTKTFGFVLTPKDFVPGLSFSVDYFDINISNVIAGIGFETIMNDCLTSGQFCNLIHRAPGSGSLWLGTQGYIVNTLQNVGSYETSGLDFVGNYHFALAKLGLPDYGSMAFDFNGTSTSKYSLQSQPGAAKTNCLGLYGPLCDGSSAPDATPVFKWRHSLRATWTTPWYDIGISGNWRYMGALKTDGSSTLVAQSVPAYSYFDLEASMKIKKNYTLRVGVNNVFDKDPPVIGSALPAGAGNGNTFPQLYDSLGRYMFMNLTANF